MDKWLFITFLFTLSLGHAQDKQLTAQIFDQSTGESIPFSTIEIKGFNMGTVADGSGYFQLEISPEHLSAFFLIRSLGYQDTTISIRAFLDLEKTEIYLQPETYELASVEITPTEGKLVQLGIDAKTTKTGYTLARWMQVAVYMENVQAQTGILKSASFYIGKNPAPKAPFRIRVYSKNRDGSPSKDLLTKSIIVAGKKGGRWLTIDLSEYKLLFPKDGLFIAMEWVLSDSKYYYTTKMGSQKLRFYGQELGNILTPSAMQKTWIQKVGNKWGMDDRVFEIKGEKYIRNALIKCEVLF